MTAHLLSSPPPPPSPPCCLLPSTMHPLPCLGTPAAVASFNLLSYRLKSQLGSQLQRI